MFENIRDWHDYVVENWLQLREQAIQSGLNSYYEILLGISIIPCFPKDKEELTLLLNVIASERYTLPLVERLGRLYDSVDFSKLTVQYVVNYVVIHAINKSDELQGVERLLLATGALAGSQRMGSQNIQFVEQVLAYLRETVREASAIRVQAEMITAGDNVIIAGHDVNVVSTYYKGNQANLKTYLGYLRAEWNQPDLGRILPGKKAGTSIKFHQLYTPVDIWGDVIYAEADESRLTELRYSAIDQDHKSERIPVLEAIASKPLIVITGAAGTGKTSLARYITISLAYACDPDSEEADNVKGLDLLGPAWIHGALLPLYVNLRNFAADRESFPKSIHEASSRSLLAYLRKSTDSLSSELENYLTQTEVPLHGSFLILDGLDEVYNDGDRISLQKIIEKWVEQFPKCRVLVTSRNHAYRKSAEWRLSERFTTAELAPYTWKQIQIYIHNWYTQAAVLRPANFGGRDNAIQRTGSLEKDLVGSIIANKKLWPLAKQPLLLALIALIHEDNKKLPDRKAQLYEETVDLLNRWNPPIEGDPFSANLADLDLHLVRLALQLLAFDLQRNIMPDQKYPSSITRDALHSKLEYQEKQSGKMRTLGAPINLIVSYLETRNGILISDREGVYRFPHLSIQEYLAACALIEQYDECKMPSDIKREEPKEAWTFPENIVALVLDNPSKWREVAIFVGSILANGKDQDRRWGLIQDLLPRTPKVLQDYAENNNSLSKESLYSIFIAAEIWAEVWLKPRKISQEAIKTHLIKCLEAIRFDSRLDDPERSQAITILGRLETDS